MEIGTPPSTRIDVPKSVEPDHQRIVAEDFEASFLAEMLKYTGINKTSESFGGGAGEDAFSSMLNDAYAKALVEAGGIGIADYVYQSLQQKTSQSEK